MSLSSGGEQPLTRRQLRELERAREAAEAGETTGQPLLQATSTDTEQMLTSPIDVLPAELRNTVPDAARTRTEPPATEPPAPAASVVVPAPALAPAPVKPSEAAPLAPAPEAPGQEAAPAQGVAATVDSPPAPPAAAEVPPAVAATLPDHPLTRRELRALLQAQAQASATPESAPASPASPATPSAEPVAQQRSAPDAAPAPTPVSQQAAPAAPAPAFARPVVVQQQEPAAVHPVIAEQPTVAEPFQREERPVEPPVVSAPESQTGGAEPRLFQPPTGHWSLGSGAFDEVIKGEDDPHSRSVESSGASTSSNALIIPSVPSIADITAPLTAAGEILMTGSIDLPRGLGSTGQLPNRFDGSDVDTMFDRAESAAVTDAVPVSASRAISTHVPTRNVIAPPRQQSTRLPTILAVTAGVVAVAVAGLFAAGFIFHIF